MIKQTDIICPKCNNNHLFIEGKEYPAYSISGKKLEPFHKLSCPSCNGPGCEECEYFIMEGNLPNISMGCSGTLFTEDKITTIDSRCLKTSGRIESPSWCPGG